MVGCYATGNGAGERRLIGELDMPLGTVKWFNTSKGFGFIEPDGGGDDVFVHISAVEGAGMTGLTDNQKVNYELVEGRDGRKMAGDISSTD
jgi:CspA family cold shock protein